MDLELVIPSTSEVKNGNNQQHTLLYLKRRCGLCRVEDDTWSVQVCPLVVYKTTLASAVREAYSATMVSCNNDKQAYSNSADVAPSIRYT